jgi:hypothetical protein
MTAQQNDAHEPPPRASVSLTTEATTLATSGAASAGLRPTNEPICPCEGRFWERKLGPAKAYYLWGLGDLGGPHIWCFLEGF